MHRRVLLILTIPLLVLLAFSFIKKANIKQEPSVVTTNISSEANVVDVIDRIHISEAKHFLIRNKFNQQYCFLVDMSQPSGHKRFFIYDLKKDSIIDGGLVTHGNCNQYWLEGRRYGNTVGCGCTSLGKYRIGKPYYGKFGLAYKLYGLDSTNSNAFNRFVVLHSHACVPSAETKDDICQSNGCPTVNPSFLSKLQALIDTSRQPVLLWIYD